MGQMRHLTGLCVPLSWNACLAFLPLNHAFLPDAALNSSAALLFVRHR